MHFSKRPRVKPWYIGVERVWVSKCRSYRIVTHTGIGYRPRYVAMWRGGKGRAWVLVGRRTKLELAMRDCQRHEGRGNGR